MSEGEGAEETEREKEEAGPPRREESWARRVRVNGHGRCEL